MDPRSTKHHEEQSGGAGTKLKLPKIHKSSKHAKVRVSEPRSASTSGSDNMSSKNVLPQIVASSSASGSTGLAFTSTDKNLTSTDKNLTSTDKNLTFITEVPSESRSASMTERQRIPTPHQSAAIDESSKAPKLRRLKTRGIMTLLSPTPADIEDAITRHGPYEGALPVIRTEVYNPEVVRMLRTNTSLREVMAVIDQVSYREVGFDPEQLVRTDPTVAKAVSAILQEYTNEDQETLTKIVLALCDDRMSNSEVLAYIETNVKARTQQNIAVYFAMAFFISKTQDPTRTQSSNSALMEDTSPSGSKTFLRSDSSVNFLLSALSKFMLLAQTAASGVPTDQKLDPPSHQHRQSFVQIAELVKRFAESSRRYSFDFQTPSGWFFEEVAVDEDIVETIRQSMPSLVDLVTKAELLFKDREQKVEVQSTERGGKKSPKYKKSHGSGLTTAGEGSGKAPPRKDKTHVSRQASPRKDRVKSPKRPTEIPEQTKEGEVFSSKASTKRRTPGRRGGVVEDRRQQFSGSDSTTELPSHLMKRLPKETDLILPLLQSIRRFERKDASESSEQDDRTQRTITSLTSPFEGKDVSESSQRDVRTQSTSEKSIKSITKTRSFESTLKEPRVRRALKVAFRDTVVKEPSGQDVDLSVILPPQSLSLQSLSLLSLSTQSLSTPSLSSLKPSTKATLTVAPVCTAEARPIESAQTYLSRHRILELFSDLITHLVMTMPQNPLDSLIDTVHQLNEFKEIENYCNKRSMP